MHLVPTVLPTMNKKQRLALKSNLFWKKVKNCLKKRFILLICLLTHYKLNNAVLAIAEFRTNFTKRQLTKPFLFYYIQRSIIKKPKKLCFFEDYKFSAVCHQHSKSVTCYRLINFIIIVVFYL